MLRSHRGVTWRNRASIAGLLALLTAGCTTGGMFGSPAATAPAGSAAPAPAGSAAPPASSSWSDKIERFFAGSSAKSRQVVAGASSDLNCPPVEIREGAATLAIGPQGDNAPLSLKYQGSFERTARQCAVVGGNMVMKIGVQGRIIVGPAGGPGQVDVPLRIAVVQETPGSSKPITTKFVRIPVTVAGAEGAPFTHIEEAMSFPLPTPSGMLDDYVVYVGFDPLTAEMQDKQKAPKPRAKPKRKLKPKPTAGSG